MTMTATAPRPDCGGSSVVDLAAVQADDALLDALGRTGAVPSGWRAPQGNARFAQAVLAWRRDAAAVTTPRTAAVPPLSRGGRRYPDPSFRPQRDGGSGQTGNPQPLRGPQMSNPAAADTDPRFTGVLVIEVMVVLALARLPQA